MEKISMLITGSSNGSQIAPLRQNFSNQSPLNGNADAGALDISGLSSEASGPDGQVNPAILQMMYETKLQSDLQALEQAKAAGGQEQSEQALQSLGQTYTQAKQQQIPLNPELENAVKQALGLSEGSDGGSGNGNLDALNNGGGADGGGTNGLDGSGADNSGGGGSGMNTDGGASGGGSSGGANGLSGGSGGRSGGGGGRVDGDSGPPPDLSADDKRFLDGAISQDSKSFGDLVTAWRQGAEGNCSTVATIKAAMDRYDNQVFDQVNKTDNGYNIVMQDGYKMTLSNSELAAATQASRFKGPDGPAKSYANFLYGAAAKRNALDNKMSLRASFNDLNNGESVHNPPKLLGLKHQVVKVNPRTLNGQDSVVGASNRHAVFIDRNANGGHTTDRWGKRSNFNGTDGANRGLVTAFTFKPRSGNSTPARKG
ncbi:MAG: hypothetical protein WC314_03810 [Vulcanimicrobiota bacterium]